MSILSVSNVGTALQTKKYSMQFWLFFKNFVATDFKGLRATWDKHNKIEIRESTGLYLFDCYPIFDSTNPVYDLNFYSFPIILEEWNFVHCSMDVRANFFIVSTLTHEAGLPYPGTAPDLINSTTSNFTLQDLSTVGFYLISIRTFIHKTYKALG